jgi:hypothetical protein
MHVGNFGTFHLRDSILRTPYSSPPNDVLKGTFGLTFFVLRAHLELPLYSQWDTNICLSRRCADFRIFSETGMSGMEFELQ